ncbi:MAG: PAS domain S-box protein [Leptolyngbya sp. BL-A-14]
MVQVSRTLLVVEDSPEDRELYRRYLLSDRKCSYTILEASSGRQGLELWQQHQPDAVLLDYQLPDLSGLEFLAQLQALMQQADLPVVVVTGQGNETIAVQAMKAGAQDYLTKGQIAPAELQLAISGAISTVQLRNQLHQRLERERLVSQITCKIHQTLDLNEILQTTVTEVRQFLQTDRVLIFRLQPDGWGTVTNESVKAEWTALLSTSYHDPCLEEAYIEPFRYGLATMKPDIYDGTVNPCHVELLAKLQVRANLVVPILQHDHLWGLLIAHHCAAPRQWQPLEVDLLAELATQVGIALQQAELYQQAQRELAERRRVEVELQQRERLFSTLAEASPVAIFRFDTSHNCIYVNDRWSELTGRPVAESMGMGWVAALHPDDRDRLAREWLHWSQDTQRQPLYQNEGRCLRPDGRVVWYFIQALAETDAEGKTAGYVGVLVDITTLKQTETALKDSQNQLQQQLAEIETIYQSAPIGLNVLDAELRFVRINQRLADMNGLSVKAHLGRTVREVVPGLADAAEQLLLPILETGEPLLNVEITGETPAQPGVQRTWLEHFLPLKSGDRVIGISTVCEEITERKRLEAERHRIETELRQAKEELENRVVERTAALQHMNVELQQSESNLRSFFNSGGIMMAIVELHDQDIRYISANHAIAEFLGTTPEALQNQFASALKSTQEPMPQWLDYYRKAQELQAPIRFESHYIKAGRPGWLSVSLCPIVVSASGYPRFSCIAKDITDRKQAEDILAVREEQLRLTLEFTHIGTWDWNVQTDEVVWNDNHFRLLGLEPETTTALYQLWRNAIHPDDVERVQQALLKALADHTDYESEYRIIYPDGSIHWLVGRGRGVYDDHTRTPIRMLGVILDISDRKQAEQLLELQAVITRNMAEGICLVQENNGIIVYANPKFEQMFGYDSEELNGCHVSIVNYATDENEAEAVNQSIRSAVLQKGEATYEVHNVKKDGTPFWCSATTSVFQHPAYGNVLVAVQQDITDHKQAEKSIAASLKEKEVLLKEIHHRVKNNLGIVSGLLQMQARRTQDPQANAILRDSQNRIASIALVHEKLYRSEDLANVDFAQYLRDLTVHLFDSYNVSSKQIALKIEVEQASLEIETAIPCGLIVNELVSNALKHAFPEERVGIVRVMLKRAVSSKLEDERHALLTLSVCDNGVGLPNDSALAQATTLGLSLVRGLVSQIRGTIEIDRTHGTDFKVTFTS